MDLVDTHLTVTETLGSRFDADGGMVFGVLGFPVYGGNDAKPHFVCLAVYINIYITYMYMYILYIMSLLFRSEAFLFFLSESRFQLVFMMKTACYLEDHPTDRKW